MMRIINKIRVMDAVYWPRKGFDKFGKPKFDYPQEIKCRWQDTAEEYIDDEGTRQASSAIVFAGFDIKPGDYLKKGKIDMHTPDSPLGEDGAWEVVKFEKLPTLKADNFLRRAYL